MDEKTRFQKESCMASESDQHGSTMAWDLLRVFGMEGICILLSFPQTAVVYGIDLNE